MYLLKNKSSLHLPVESKTDKQIQIGLPVIWTGHARLKRHYVNVFYITFVTLIGATRISCGNINYSSAGVRKSLLRHDVRLSQSAAKTCFQCRSNEWTAAYMYDFFCF